MKFYKTILAAMAVALPLSAGIGNAFSYFTANAGAQGGVGVEIGPPKTEITETFGEWTKHVAITNTGDIPVYVRVQAFSGSKYPLTYSTGGAWELKDNYYFYNTILAPGDVTTALDIKISGVEEADKDSFNVVVIYERTPAGYNADGTLKAPDWNYSVREENILGEGESEE